MSTINRTNEYVEFMRQLADFHEKKGTKLTAEPVLGGKKLDLLQIYKTVISAGGCEKVTQNRGWKQVGDPFDFPSTCTNSAYMLKLYYMNNLVRHKNTANINLPKVGWEEEKYWHRPWNPPKESTDKKIVPARVDATIPKQDPLRQTGTAFIRAHPPPQPFPSTAPVGLMDEEFPKRILLALQSTLPNETDWAFNELVIFSFYFTQFDLRRIPTLVDILIDFAAHFFEKHVQTELCSRLKDEFDPAYTVFSDKGDQELLERVLQVFHILRNFSFSESNIELLANHKKLRTMLTAGIDLPAHSEYSELTRHCLDILENIATKVKVTSPEDPYLVAMTKLLYASDRALILGAIRSLTRVAVNPFNEKELSSANSQLVKRMAQCLLVDDEELVAAALDYLNQYSELPGDFAALLVKEYPGNLIGLLTGFLSYKSTLMESPDNTNASVIPDLTNYSHLDEPYRCLGWIKDKLVLATSEDKLALGDVYARYQTLFNADKPLGLKEFHTVFKIAFPQPAPVDADGPLALSEVILHNAKFAKVVYQCQWADCNEAFDLGAQLHNHINEKHFLLMEDGQYWCRWMNCPRGKAANKAALIRHLRIHFAAKKQMKQQKRAPESKILPIDHCEVSGVPLTAALLLRNLSKHEQNHINYLPYKADLSLLAIQRPELAKYVWRVFTDLQIN